MLPVIFRGQEEAGFFVHALTSSGGRDDLVGVLPDNRPADDGGYVCVIPVLDFWRLHPGHCADAGVPHFSSAIEPAVLEHVRTGRALLLFDLSNEGPPFNGALFDIIHGYLDENEVPTANAVWLAQNRAIEPAYRAHYAGQRDSFLGFEYYDFFLKVIAARFADPAYTAQLGGDIERFCAAQFELAAKDRTFLCLNATPRPHRVLTIAALISHSLLSDALVSFPGLAYEKGRTDFDSILAYIDAHPDLTYLRDSCVAAVQLPKLQVDDFAAQGNMLFDMIDPRAYRRTFFSLVTETEMSDGSVARITEKALKAYALGHPCHIVGNPSATRFIAELGFDTFSDCLDLSYERIQDPAQRFNLMIQSVTADVTRIKADASAWLARVAATGAANIRHALSGELLRRYVARHDEPTIANLQNRLSDRAHAG